VYCLNLLSNKVSIIEKGMSLKLVSTDRFWTFLMVFTRSVILAKFVSTATSRTIVICTHDSQQYQLGYSVVFSDILVFVLLPMLINYLMVACVHVALVLRLKLNL
jgi:hypothetical protein